MSQREVAQNRNWKHGDMLCPRCSTSGRHDVLRPGVCSACGKATCCACRGGGDDRNHPHAHARFCAALRVEAANVL